MSAISDSMPRAGGSLAPLGRETIYVTTLYIRQAIIFVCLGLAVVLSLDAANNFAYIMSRAPEDSGLDGPARMALYLLLRAGYVLPSLLPIAAIVAAVWAEYILASSRERIMIANSGRSPTRSLIPALLFGLGLGLLEFVAIAYGRPAAVEAQGSLGFRHYGPRFERPITTPQRWIAGGQVVANARVEFDEGVALRDALVYSFDAAGRLEAIISAARIAPSGTPGIWRFEQGSLWDLDGLSAGRAGPAGVRASDFAVLRRPLQLDPVWLESIEVLPPLLPQADLTSLAAGPAGIPDAAEYQAAYHERFAGILLCAGMALLGASLALLMFAPGMGPVPAMKIGIAGGIAYVVSNAASMLGTYGNVSPILAAWGVPVALVVVALGLIWRRHRHVRARLGEMLRQS